MNDKSIRPINSKGKPHGYWCVYCYGELLYRGFYKNGKLVEYSEIFYITGGNNCNGKIAIKTYYI